MLGFTSPDLYNIVKDILSQWRENIEVQKEANRIEAAATVATALKDSLFNVDSIARREAIKYLRQIYISEVNEDD